MPDNDKEVVSTIECCDHAEAFVPKSVDNSNLTAVVTTQNITLEDKSSYLGVSFVTSVTMTSITKEIVTTSESGLVFALGNSHAVETIYSDVHSEGEKSSGLDSASPQSNPMSINANDHFNEPETCMKEASLV